MQKGWSGGNLVKTAFTSPEISSGYSKLLSGGLRIRRWTTVITRIENLGIRWCKRVSALSTFNRSVGDYDGCNGYGELGFDSGELALKIANITKVSSRRVNYPIPIRGDSDKKYRCGALRVSRSKWVQFKNLNEEQLEGKSGASSRGNSSSSSVYSSCCG